MATTSDPTAATPDDPAALQASIRARQQRLADSVDELHTRLTPQDIARRATDSAQRKAQDAVTAEDGSLRTERIAAVGAAVAAVLGLVVWRKARH